MRIKIHDIPKSGKDIAFQIPLGPLNARMGADRIDATEPIVQPPRFSFVKEPEVTLNLQLEGSTVFAKGEVSGSLSTTCARCAEDVQFDIGATIEMVLQPENVRDSRALDSEEINIGFHDGREIDCVPFSEDAVVAVVPFTAYCSDNCKGLCPRCGVNLNQGLCKCPPEVEPESEGDPRMSIFKKLKVN
jgi:uncharacterized protein